MKIHGKPRLQSLKFFIFAGILVLILTLCIVTIRIITPSLTTYTYQKSLGTTPRIEFPDIDTAGLLELQLLLETNLV
jgi:p-aminobenzoyl-glutamate transporter AbgT